MQTDYNFSDDEDTSLEFMSSSMDGYLPSCSCSSSDEEGNACRSNRKIKNWTDDEELHTFQVNCDCADATNLMFHNCFTKYLNCPRIVLGLNFGTTIKSITLHVNGPDRKMSPFLIGICGGTASGKTTVCQKVIQELGQAEIPEEKRKVVVIAQDSFYRNLSDEEKLQAEFGKFNFDSPYALDYELMMKTVDSILRGDMVKIPVYNYKTNSRTEGVFETIYPADVVLFEGILVFHFKTVLNSFHMKVFVDTDSDIRLSRRILRDVEKRGRNFEHVINQYIRTVKPAYEEYCGPTKRFADIIIPGGDNKWGITLIVQHIKELLLARNGHIVEKNAQIIKPKLTGTVKNVTPINGTSVNTNGHVNGTFKINRTNGLH